MPNESDRRSLLIGIGGTLLGTLFGVCGTLATQWQTFRHEDVKAKRELRIRTHAKLYGLADQWPQIHFLVSNLRIQAEAERARHRITGQQERSQEANEDKQKANELLPQEITLKRELMETLADVLVGFDDDSEIHSALREVFKIDLSEFTSQDAAALMSAKDTDSISKEVARLLEKERERANTARQPLHRLLALLARQIRD